jgi:hypothetical protein
MIFKMIHYPRGILGEQLKATEKTKLDPPFKPP